MRRDASLFGSWNILWTTLNDLGAVAAPRLTTNLASNLVKMHFVSFSFFYFGISTCFSIRFDLLWFRSCVAALSVVHLSLNSSLLLLLLLLLNVLCAVLSWAVRVGNVEPNWNGDGAAMVSSLTPHATQTLSDRQRRPHDPLPHLAHWYRRHCLLPLLLYHSM